MLENMGTCWKQLQPPKQAAFEGHPEFPRRMPPEGELI